MDSDFINFVRPVINAFRGNGTDVSIPDCKTRIDHYRLYQLSLIPAVILILVFAGTKKRRQILLSKLDGRPGLVYPMDTLTRTSRISYCCAFGATAYLVYNIVVNQLFAIEYHGSVAVQALLAVVSMFIYGSVFFPVFACLALRTAFAYGLGSLYVWVFFVIRAYQLFECGSDSVALLLFRGLPSYISLTFLSVSLPIRFGIAIKKRRYTESKEDKPPRHETLAEIKESYQGQHVRSLLVKPKPKPFPPNGFLNTFKHKVVQQILLRIYRPKKGFRYPARLAAVMFVSACVIYVITFELLYITVVSFNAVFKYLSKLKDPDESDELYTLIITCLRVVKICVIVSVTLTGLASMINIIHMMSAFRTNLEAMYRGKYKYIPPPSDVSASVLCVGSIKYAGFQVAYLVWGFAILCIILFICCFIAAIIVLLLISGETSWLVDSVIQIWPSIVIAVALIITMRLLARFVFLQGNAEHLRLDNRRFYFIFTYFMFFYNIFIGIFSCLLRIFRAMFVGIIVVARLDNSTLPRRFESFDPGFQAYQGFIHMEAANTHPVMLVFIRLLISLMQDTKLRGSNDVTGGAIRQGEEKSRPSRRAARFHWHLVYTLLHNPTIRIYRKGFTQALKIARREGFRLPISDMPVTDFDLVKLQAERLKERERERNEREMEQRRREEENPRQGGARSAVAYVRSKLNVSKPRRRDSGEDVIGMEDMTVHVVEGEREKVEEEEARNRDIGRNVVRVGQDRYVEVDIEIGRGGERAEGDAEPNRFTNCLREVSM